MRDEQGSINWRAAIKAGLRKGHKLASGEIARASVASLIIKVFGLAFSLGQAVLTARLLGANGYGVVAVTISAVQVLATLAVFGLGPLAVREIPARLAAGESGRVGEFIHHALVAVLLLSFFVGSALALVAENVGWADPLARSAFAIGGLLIAPVAVIALFRGVAQGFGRIPLAQTPGELLQPAFVVIGVGIGALLGVSFAPISFLWLYAVAALLAAIVAAAWLWRTEWTNLRLGSNLTRGRVRLRPAFPFVALALAGMLQGEINTLLLGWLGSPEQAGIFQPVVRFSSVLALPVNAAAMRFAPEVAELWARRDTQRIYWISGTFTWTTTVLTLAGALGISIAGPWLMRLFGPEFVESAPLLWVIAAVQIFNAGCGPVGYLLTMSDKSRWALAGQSAGLTVNAVVAAVLIPLYGALGAVLGMAAGIALWNLTMLLMVKSHLGFDPSVLRWVRLRRLVV